MPLISVIMGVYYHRESLTYLERSVRSILTQSEADFEFLICDDGSSEDAKHLLDSLAEEDVRICLLRPGGMLALPQKLNYCLSQASGAYIARMDDDDYSHSGRFARQITFLESHPETAFVGCNVNLFQNGNAVGQRFFPELPKVSDFYFSQPYIHPSVILRRDAIMSVNGYSEDKHCILCEDYDLFLRLYAAGYQGANLQEILFDYTVPASGQSSRRMRHRWNETVTRWRRFRELKVLPRALPYVVKPLLVGLIPTGILERLRKQREKRMP